MRPLARLLTPKSLGSSLSKTHSETLWREKSHRESRRESQQDPQRDFPRRRVSPRVSVRIICMTLSETLSGTLFFTRAFIGFSRRLLKNFLSIRILQMVVCCTKEYQTNRNSTDCLRLHRNHSPLCSRRNNRRFSNARGPSMRSMDRMVTFSLVDTRNRNWAFCHCECEDSTNPRPRSVS